MKNKHYDYEMTVGERVIKGGLSGPQPDADAVVTLLKQINPTAKDVKAKESEVIAPAVATPAATAKQSLPPLTPSKPPSESIEQPGDAKPKG